MRFARYIPVLAAMAGIGSLSASSFIFATPTGSKDLGDGDPLSAQALFTVGSVSGGTNNQLTVTLDNLEANPSEDGQILDALTFQLTNQNLNAGAIITLSTSINEAIDIQNNDDFSGVKNCNGIQDSKCSKDDSNWTTTATVSGTSASFDLCDAHIASIGCTNTYTAKEGVIGAPNPQTDSYSNFNTGSGKNLHNPYIFESITFTATIDAGGGSFNLPSAYANIGNVEFGFGESGTDVTAVEGEAPEPSGAALFAAALASGLAAYRYRRYLTRS